MLLDSVYLSFTFFHGLMSGNCDGSDDFFQMMVGHKETTEAVLDNWPRFKGGENHL